MIYLNKVFEMKKIIYDFDGTLTPFSIPRFSILEKCGYEDGALNPKFLNEVKAIKLPFVYDAKYTFESNIGGLKNTIENEIIKLFERK